MQQIRAGRALWRGGERGPAAAPRSAAQGAQGAAHLERCSDPPSLLHFYPTETYLPGPGTRPRIPNISRFRSFCCSLRQSAGQRRGETAGHPPSQTLGAACPAETPTSAHLSPAPFGSSCTPVQGVQPFPKNYLPTGWDKQDGEMREFSAGISSKSAFRTRMSVARGDLVVLGLCFSFFFFFHSFP